MQNTLPEGSCLPVGNGSSFGFSKWSASGYAEPVQYLQRCRHRNDVDAQRKFSLRFALEQWKHELPSGWMESRVGNNPRCLIQGSASNDNVASLTEFLLGQGIDSPDIHVIDLIDLKGLGFAEQNAHYHQANAADLSIFADGSISLVVQDHMLNCAPIGQYDAIMGEITRILTPRGIAMLHYTDSSLFPNAQGHELKRWLNPDGSRYRLELPPALTADIARSSPAERLIEVEGGFVMVTLPLFNLEYFIAFEQFCARMACAGLHLQHRRTVPVVDTEGLNCHRNHCLFALCQ